MEQEKKADKPDLGGQPTSWRPEYNEMIVAHFDKEACDLVFDKNGRPYPVMREKFPTFEAFAHKIKVNTDTLVEWAKKENREKYPGYSAAYARAKEMQKSFLLQATMAGAANSAFAIFFAKNNLGMKDKTESDVTSNGNTVNVLTFGASDPLKTAIENAKKPREEPFVAEGVPEEASGKEGGECEVPPGVASEEPGAEPGADSAVA